MHDNLVDIIVVKNKQLYPKTEHKEGEYGIVSCEIKKIEKGKEILKTHPIYKTITIKGTMPKMIKDKEYKVIGTQVFDENYKTYSIDIGFIDIYDDKLNIEDFDEYLKYVMTKSEFKKLSKIENIKEVLDNGDIETLISIKGIGEKKAKVIIEKYSKNKQENIYKAKLASYGVTEGLMNKLKERYNSYETAISKIENNFYILAEDIVHGLGFKTVDALALRNGVDKLDSKRIKAYIIYLLKNGLSEGKSFLPTSYILNSIYQEIFDGDITMSKQELGKIFSELFLEKIVWRSEDKTKLALCYARDLEYKLSKEITRLYNSKPKNIDINWQKVVKEIEKEQGWEYTNQQLKAIETVFNNSFVVITGYAGTGKSTTLKPMTKILVESQKKKLSQCALSGKAANRIEEVTGYEAKTIHRLLDYNPQKGFSYNEFEKLDTDIVVLDEASMADAYITLKLLEAIKTGTKVILLGDIGQLPSLGQGAILLDLINSLKIPCVQLDIVHRQAKVSGIVSTSAKVRKKEMLVPFNYEGVKTIGDLKDLTLDVNKTREGLIDKVVEYFKKEFDKYKDIMQILIIVATTSRGQLSALNINKRIKDVYNPIKQGEEAYVEVSVDKTNKYYLSIGDKILVTKNNYKAQIYNEKTKEFEKGEIYNGSTGIITAINVNSIEVEIKGIGKVLIESKDYNTIQLGYAITSHKSQGSEYKSTIIAIDMSSYMLLSTEWLYTSITRAKENCIIVCEAQALYRGCTYQQGNTKNTFLQEFLMEE